MDNLIKCMLIYLFCIFVIIPILRYCVIQYQKKNMENIQNRYSSIFSTEAIMECLKEAYERFKHPMIELLKRYYMINYNTKTEVDINILKSLGFKPCSICCAVSNSQIKNF